MQDLVAFDSICPVGMHILALSYQLVYDVSGLQGFQAPQ